MVRTQQLAYEVGFRIEFRLHSADLYRLVFFFALPKAYQHQIEEAMPQVPIAYLHGSMWKNVGSGINICHRGEMIFIGYVVFIFNDVYHGD